MPIVPVEEPSLLFAMGGIVGGVQIENDLLPGLNRKTPGIDQLESQKARTAPCARRGFPNDRASEGMPSRQQRPGCTRRLFVRPDRCEAFGGRSGLRRPGAMPMIRWAHMERCGWMTFSGGRGSGRQAFTASSNPKRRSTSRSSNAPPSEVRRSP